MLALVLVLAAVIVTEPDIAAVSAVVYLKFYVDWVNTLMIEDCQSILWEGKINQLEKLEDAKAAWLVDLSLLSLNRPYLALLGLAGPYLALLTD